MAEISSKIYMIVGPAVATLSLLINIIRKETSMTLFVFAGVMLFVFGLFKFLSKKKESQEQHDKHMRGDRKHPHDISGPHPAQKAIPPDTKHAYHPPKFCMKCGNNIQMYDNFCANCGFRSR